MDLSFFLSVLYLSVSKSAASAPSVMACAVSSVASPSRTSESEIVHGARFQIAQRGARNFSQRGGVKLFALPCSDQQQPRGFQSGRRMDEGDLERLAGEFAALVQASEQAVR